MKKKTTILLVISLLLTLALSACGEAYTCYLCEKTTSKAYYGLVMDKNYVMCEDCAMEYWHPFDYRNYRVK